MRLSILKTPNEVGDVKYLLPLCLVFLNPVPLFGGPEADAPMIEDMSRSAE